MDGILNSFVREQDRLAYGQVHGIAPDRKGPAGCVSAVQPRLFPAPTGGATRRRRRGGHGMDARGNGLDVIEDDHEEAYAGNRCGTHVLESHSLAERHFKIS